MRNEQEMLELILRTAREDERIRAVIMNGSRVNPNAPHDFFQDFDIVYLVREVAPFKNNLAWIRRFGELMILQMPEEIAVPAPSNDGGFAYLMQFTDGNRIDLGIYPLEMHAEICKDSLSVTLLDKDGFLPRLPPPGEASYLPHPPTPKDFADCCNEFWWVAPYVAKGLWRGEIIYAKANLDQYVRDELMRILTWSIGMRTGYSLNPGKHGKYFQRYLEPDEWDLLLQTYADGSYEATWQALFAICRLFRQTALPLAERYGFEYPNEDDARVTRHLEHIYRLPQDAQEMYPD